MVFYLVVMIRYSLILTLVGILSIVINLVVSNIISRKRINITRVQMRDAGKLAATNLSPKIRPGQYVAIVGATGLLTTRYA